MADLVGHPCGIIVVIGVCSCRRIFLRRCFPFPLRTFTFLSSTLCPTVSLDMASLLAIEALDIRSAAAFRSPELCARCKSGVFLVLFGASGLDGPAIRFLTDDLHQIFGFNLGWGNSDDTCWDRCRSYVRNVSYEVGSDPRMVARYPSSGRTSPIKARSSCIWRSFASSTMINCVLCWWCLTTASHTFFAVVSFRTARYSAAVSSHTRRQLSVAQPIMQQRSHPEQKDVG